MNPLFFVDLAKKATGAAGDTISEEDLRRINSMKCNGPLRKLTAADIFVRSIYIIGEEPTSKMSIHPEGVIGAPRVEKEVRTLSEIVKKMPGAPMMEGHQKDKVPWGRCFEAVLEKDVPGYTGSVVRCRYYFMNDQEGKDRALKIDGGILAEGSISYWFEEARCSICHQPVAVFSWGDAIMSDARCGHKIGQKDAVSGLVCYWYPYKIKNVGEVSYVYRGAYPKTKSMLQCSYENAHAACYGEDEVRAAQALENQLKASGFDYAACPGISSTGSGGEDETPPAQGADNGSSRDNGNNAGGAGNDNIDGNGEHNEHNGEVTGASSDGGEGQEARARSARSAPDGVDNGEGDTSNIDNHDTSEALSEAQTEAIAEVAGQALSEADKEDALLTILEGQANLLTKAKAELSRFVAELAAGSGGAAGGGEPGSGESAGAAEPEGAAGGDSGSGGSAGAGNGSAGTADTGAGSGDSKGSSPLRSGGSGDGESAAGGGDAGVPADGGTGEAGASGSGAGDGSGSGAADGAGGEGESGEAAEPGGAGGGSGDSGSSDNGLSGVGGDCGSGGPSGVPTPLPGTAIQKKTIGCDTCHLVMDVHLNWDGDRCPECNSPIWIEEAAKLMQPVGVVRPKKTGDETNELYKLDEFKNLPTGTYYIEPKYDGLWVEVHRRKDQVKILDADGVDHTEKFPGIVEEILSVPEQHFLAIGAIVKYRGRQRCERPDVLQWITEEKTDYDDTPFRCKVFDLLVVGDRGLRKSSYEDRRALLDEKIPFGKRVQPTVYKRIKHAEGIGRISSVVQDRSTREGTMIKSAAHTYNRAGSAAVYAWRRQYKVEVEIEGIKEKRRGDYVYACKVGSGEQSRTIGNTFPTKVRASIGDILMVAIDKVVCDENAEHLSWFTPKVICRCDGKTEPDALAVVKKMAVKKGSGEYARNYVTLSDVVPALKRVPMKRSFHLVGSLVEMGITAGAVNILTRGELTPEEKADIRDALGERVAAFLEFSVDPEGPMGPSLEIVSDMADTVNKGWKHARRFVIQEHGWGKKVHFDIRFGVPKSPQMWGWTCFSKPGMTEGSAKVRCQEKKLHDPKWVDMNTRQIKPGAEGNPTKNQNAWMVKIDAGEYKLVRRKEGFLEVVLEGSKYKGRYLFREIVGNQVKHAAAGVDGDEVGVKSAKMWVMWKPQDQEVGKPVNKLAYDFRGGYLVHFELDEIDWNIEDAPEVPIGAED